MVLQLFRSLHTLKPRTILCAFIQSLGSHCWVPYMHDVISRGPGLRVPRTIQKVEIHGKSGAQTLLLTVATRNTGVKITHSHTCAQTPIPRFCCQHHLLILNLQLSKGTSARRHGPRPATTTPPTPPKAPTHPPARPRSIVVEQFAPIIYWPVQGFSKGAPTTCLPPSLLMGRSKGQATASTTMQGSVPRQPPPCNHPTSSTASSAACSRRRSSSALVQP